MKAQTIGWTTEHAATTASAKLRPLGLGRAVRGATRLLLALTGASALLVGATWMGLTPSLAPYLQALLASTGFVFLALAIEAEGPQSAWLLAATGTVLPALAWLASRVAPEFAVIGAALAAAWLIAATLRGARVFSA